MCDHMYKNTYIHNSFTVWKQSKATNEVKLWSHGNMTEAIELTSFQPISASDLSTFKEINQKIPISVVGTDDEVIRQNDKFVPKGYSYLDNVTFSKLVTLLTCPNRGLAENH